MSRELIITYDKSNEDVPVLCVAESTFISSRVLNLITGDAADALFKTLTGENKIHWLNKEEKTEC